MNLKGKTVLITGGYGGIGVALSRELLKNGVQNLCIIDIAENQVVKASLQNDYKDRKISFYNADVSSLDNLKDAFTKFIIEFQQIDIVLCCAGVYCELDPKKLIDVNLIGTIYTVQEAIKHMSRETKGNGGTIVCFASIAALVYPRYLPVYAASKHGVLGYSKSMADPKYMETTGINFMTICPGITDTILLDNLEGRVEPSFLPFLRQRYEKDNRQQPEVFAKCFIDVLMQNKLGSVWKIERGVNYEIVEFKHIVKT